MSSLCCKSSPWCTRNLHISLGCPSLSSFKMDLSEAENCPVEYIQVLEQSYLEDIYFRKGFACFSKTMPHHNSRAPSKSPGAKLVSVIWKSLHSLFFVFFYILVRMPAFLEIVLYVFIKSIHAPLEVFPFYCFSTKNATHWWWCACDNG